MAEPAEPTVSICIPVYKAGNTIGETISSVLEQSYQDFEIVVVDNASPDDTVEVVRSFDDPRIRLSVNDQNYGPFENWNRAVAATTGKYVKLLCADDRIENNCIERQVQTFENPANDGVVLVAARRTVIDNDGHPVLKARGLFFMAGRINGGAAIRRTVRSGTNPLGEPGAVLVLGDVLRKTLPWSSAYPYMIDVEMWVRVLEQGDLYAIPETLAHFRLANSGWSKNVLSEQARQASGFFKHLHEQRPDIVTRADVALGSAMATGSNYGRRGFYWYLDRRTKPKATSST